MAKKRSVRNGKSLVIVESPAKARTISKFLGKDFTVEASIGHVRDLPQGAKQIPAKYKTEKWAHLGVNVDKDFAPVYIVPPEKTKQVQKLKDLMKEADQLYLATDEDREGEAISWHLLELLKPKVPVHRLVFHEITKTAIQESLKHPRDIDHALVQAQEARRIIDRLYGYEVSPLLWRKIRPKLSAGRVQSVAVRLIVERERDRIAFKPATYWDLQGTFAQKIRTTQTGQESFSAMLVSVDGRKIPTGKDFEPTTGQLKDAKLLQMDERQARQLASRLGQAMFRVESLENKPYTSKPAAPFTTSTLQQEANRKLGFTAQRTMRTAQNLYENGWITYMRTDSTTLSQQAIEAARTLVADQYGKDYLPDEPRRYQSKVKNAQEAHEAIRPAGDSFSTPKQLRSELSNEQFKLYELIWKRTVASQMTDARGKRTLITIEADGAVFQISGKTIDFPGYLRAYVEGSDDPFAELADKETLLPEVKKGEELSCQQLEALSHTTKPPGRYSEASLTRALEEKGIGRPSTYASIIETIQGRNYVFKKAGALVPTWVAFSVIQLLEAHLSHLVDYQFTAQLEDDLDAISRGENEHVEYLRHFYFGDGTPGLKKQLENKIDEIDARDVCSIPMGTPAGDETPVFVRVGRYGPFIEQGDRRASISETLAPDELTLEICLEMLEQASKADEPLGICPETQKPVFLKTGRFGPYVQRGTLEDDEKPKNVSLLKSMDPDEVDLSMALKLLLLPRDLGIDPKSDKSVVVHTGRYGPYIKSGDETRSLGSDLSPLEITLQQALELLAQPSRRGRAGKKEPLKIFGDSPVTGEKVKLLEGRYGPYVTDGKTNASIPRQMSPEEVTFNQALDLLEARSAKGPTKKKRHAKKVTKKKSAKTAKAAKKKSTRKKAPKAARKKSTKATATK